MNFSIQTLLALISSVGLAVSAIRFPLIGIAVLIAIPVVILLIALTSPQRGTHLDPTGRSSFKLLTQIWLFSLAQIMLLVVLAGTTRSGGHFVNTLQSGSTYAYISVTMSLEDYNKIQNVFPIELRDSSGKVGDVESIQFDPKQPYASMFVVSQRWYIPYERSYQNKAEVRPNGVIFISQ